MNTVPKNADDFEQTARELLHAVLSKYQIHGGTAGMLVFDLNESKNALQYYLLDAYNDGYDAAIIASWENK